MPNKTREFSPAASVSQALAFLEENDFGGFLEQMGLLGEWLQATHHLPHYKDQEHNLKILLKKKRAQIVSHFQFLSPRQALAFEILQNAWRDQSLANLKHLRFVSACDPRTPGEPNSCIFLRIRDEPFWKIIPVDANGKKQEPLDLGALDDVEELTKRLSDDLIDLDPKNYSPEDLALVSRLKRALKRANLETVDQSQLRAKADLSKETRRRLKLGMEAFKFLCVPAENESLAEEKREATPNLNLHILDQEPSAEQQKAFKPNTYVVLRPQKGSEGRVFFYPSSNHRRKKISSEALQTALSGDQLILLPEEELFKARAQKASDLKIKNLILDYHCRQLDEQARTAIHEYKTFRQKIIRGFEYLLAGVTAFAYGTVEMVATMVGFFVAAGIVWTNPWLAILGVLLLAGAVVFPIPSTWANWKIFSTYLPSFFDKIGDEYREINSKNKKALFWGLALLALATGIASGGLAYTATIALPAMMGLGAIGFIFPPLGVVFATAIALTQTFSLTRNFINLLRKENAWKSFKKPFQEVKKFLHDNNASLGRRLVTWAMMGALTLLSVLGLMMSCFTSTRSVGKLFIDQFSMAPQKALAWGIAISAVSSFFSRIYLTVSSALSAAITVCKRLFRNNPLTFFSKLFGRYQIKEVKADLDADALKREVRLDDFNSQDEVIILTGTDPARRNAYFIKNKQWVNTEKGILQVPVSLNSSEQRALAAEEKALDPAQKNKLRWFVKKTIGQAKSEMLAKETKPYPISLKRKAAIGIDSMLGAAFYSWSIISLSQKTPAELQQDIDLHVSGLDSTSTAALATGAFLTSKARYVTIYLHHAGKPDDPYEDARKKASDRRSEKSMDFYRRVNPHSIFAQQEEKEEEPRYASLSSATFTCT